MKPGIVILYKEDHAPSIVIHFPPGSTLFSSIYLASSYTDDVSSFNHYTMVRGTLKVASPLQVTIYVANCVERNPLRYYSNLVRLNYLAGLNAYQCRHCRQSQSPACLCNTLFPIFPLSAQLCLRIKFAVHFCIMYNIGTCTK